MCSPRPTRSRGSIGAQCRFISRSQLRIRSRRHSRPLPRARHGVIAGGGGGVPPPNARADATARPVLSYSPMRRLTRSLLTLWPAASLLLCAAACALWVRSHSHLMAVVPIRTSSHLYGVSVVRGGVYLLRTEPPAGSVQRPLVNLPLRKDVSYMTVPHRLAGFGYMRASEGFPAVRVPAWFVVLLLGVIPLPTLWSRTRRARRSRAGLCPRCGYDLRGSPERCPECGTVADGQRSAVPRAGRSPR